MSGKGKGFRHNYRSHILRDIGNKAYDNSAVYSEMTLYMAKKFFKKYGYKEIPKPILD